MIHGVAMDPVVVQTLDIIPIAVEILETGHVNVAEDHEIIPSVAEVLGIILVDAVNQTRGKSRFTNTRGTSFRTTSRTSRPIQKDWRTYQ